ncbi:MAG: hypothetical protein FJW36_26140 [Acidobacteria bacterium]|nr:hypothetical protein [Acidobacteriota bacterium]
MTLTQQEESLIVAVRQLPPDEAGKVFLWAQQLREVAGTAPIQWSDSWTEEDLADATRASFNSIAESEPNGR